MIAIKGFYYDGKTANRIAASIYVNKNETLEIKTPDCQFHKALKDADISPRIANTCRSIYFSDGSKLESFDNDEIDNIISHYKKPPYQAFVHRLEQRSHYAFLVLLTTVFLIWAGIEYGVPLLAQFAAKHTAFSVERQMGEQSLKTLDDAVLQSSTLDEQARNNLIQRFQQAIAHFPNKQHFQLEFRQSKALGANALALPGGIIIITDELVHLADNPEQIIAVLGHETGHIIYQHGLRSFYQNSLTALLMVVLLGDLTSISSLSATLPTILVETRYSRQFELEADHYAVSFLKSQKINPLVFAKILERLQNAGFNAENSFDYLSTHPATAERIKRIKNTQS